METRRPVVLALAAGFLVVGLFAVASAPATGSGPPRPVCGLCNDQLVSAASEEGVELDATGSDVRIRVDESGVGHWTVRTTVNESAAARLANDTDELRAVAATALEDDYQFDKSGYRNLSVAVEDDVLVFEYVLPGMAERSVGGVLLVDYFHDQSGVRAGVTVNAQSLRLSGPNGSQVANDPASGSVDDTGDWILYGPHFDSQTYVAFASTGGGQDAVLARVAIALDSAPAMLFRGAFVSLPALAVVALFSRGFLLTTGFASDVSTPGLTKGVTSVGAVGVALGTFSFRSSLPGSDAHLLAFPLAYAFVALAVGSTAGSGRGTTLKRATVGATAGAVVAVAVAGGQSLRSLLVPVALASAPLSVLVLGYADARVTRLRFGAIAALGLAQVLAASAFGPYGGIGLVLFFVGYPIVAGVLLVASAPIYLLGWRLGSETPRGSEYSWQYRDRTRS